MTAASMTIARHSTIDQADRHRLEWLYAEFRETWRVAREVHVLMAAEAERMDTLPAGEEVDSAYDSYRDDLIPRLVRLEGIHRRAHHALFDAIVAVAGRAHPPMADRDDIGAPVAAVRVGRRLFVATGEFDLDSSPDEPPGRGPVVVLDL